MLIFVLLIDSVLPVDLAFFGRHGNAISRQLPPTIIKLASSNFNTDDSPLKFDKFNLCSSLRALLDNLAQKN